MTAGSGTPITSKRRDQGDDAAGAEGRESTNEARHDHHGHEPAGEGASDQVVGAGCLGVGRHRHGGQQEGCDAQAGSARRSRCWSAPDRAPPRPGRRASARWRAGPCRAGARPGPGGRRWHSSSAPFDGISRRMGIAGKNHHAASQRRLASAQHSRSRKPMVVCMTSRLARQISVVPCRSWLTRSTAISLCR